MTSSGAPAEDYPGEALDLLRSIQADVAALRAVLDEFGPLIQTARDGGGLLSMARAARRTQNGARDDYPTPSGPGSGAGIGPGIWGRRAHSRGPGTG
jgi:hypothetical protein